jgi:hypothetical protein
MKSIAYFIFVSLFMLSLISCAAPATPVPSTVTPTSSPVPTDTVAPTNTPKPTPVEISSIPGFEDWSVFNAPVVDIASQGGALVLTLKYQALWFMKQRGVIAYKNVDGDFKITADVYTSKHSAPDQPPGGDGTVQLGGVMSRNGEGGQENYVFIVVGDDGDGLSIETKNTTDNFSEYAGPKWDAPNAELRICRIGQTFHLYKRHVGSDEAWISAASFDRPDLPKSLQVGVNIYSANTPDLQVRYENISIEPVTSEADCTED